jgi:hypothetical protein
VKAFENDWRRLQNILLLLLVLSLCLYLPTLFHYAFADDDIYLAYANRFLRESPWTELYQFFLRPANPWEFLPLRDFTYWIDFRIYGDELGGFHLTNLLWYGAAGAANYYLLREFILLSRPEWEGRAVVLALCGTVLFMVHPAHVEAVAWIASRKDLVAATLQFLGLALLARALRVGWPFHLMLSAAVLLFLACFGKASAMTAVLMATVSIIMVRRSEVTLRGKLGYLLLFWGLIALAFLIHTNVGEARNIRIDNHPGLFLMVDRASRVFVTQIGILLFPYPLHFYYDVYRLGDWHWLISAAAAMLSIASLWILLLRRSLWALGIVLTFTPLLVYLQLMPYTTWSLASERFAFVSVAGLALLLIDLCGHIGKTNRIAALLLAIVLPCAIAVWLRVGEWESTSSLNEREYVLQPNFHNAIRNHIVFVLLHEKRYAEAEDAARKVQRAYAAEALLRLVSVERAFRKLGTDHGATVGDRDRAEFCSTVSNLRRALHEGYRALPSEADVSYSNLLRSLDRQLQSRYADERKMCR